MESSTRVPRASIAVSILRDPEYLDLVGQPGGFAAFGIFVALVTLAREQNHGGDLSKHHMRTVASMIGATQEQLENALNLLELTCSESDNPKGLWLVRTGKSLRVRQYRKWNQSGWGGSRAGAGQKSRVQDDQVGIKNESSCADSDSDSDSDTDAEEENTTRGGSRQIDEVVKLIALSGNRETAGLWQAAVGKALADAGYYLEFEQPVEDRGDGKSGFVDIVAEKHHQVVAIELDRVSPRQKSFDKLKNILVDGRIVGLREGKWRGQAPSGIRVVLAPDSAQIPAPRAKSPKSDLFPEALDTQEFRSAWRRWTQHRIEIRHKLTPTTISRQLASLAKIGSVEAVARIDQSIEQGWQGLFPREKERHGQPKFRA